MLNRRGLSGWKYDTSATTAVSGGAGVVGGGIKGLIYLESPEGSNIAFHCFLAGVGGGIGFKVGGTNSTKESYSSGQVWILNSFKGKELQVRDLTGICMALDISAGIGLGVGMTGLVLGIPPDSSSMAQQLGVALAEGLAAIGGGDLAGDGLRELERRYDILSDTGKAILIMRGFNAGVNIGASMIGMAGLVWMSDVSELNIKVDFKGHIDIPRFEIKEQRSGYEIIRIPGTILFDFDRDTIGTKERPREAEAVLTQVGRRIQARRVTAVTVEGHTDSVPGPYPDYNKGLSQRRARNVAQWFVQHRYCKLAETYSVGFGPSRPVDTNATKEGRANNRRVDIVLKY